MDTQRDLLHEWYRRVAVTQYAHYLSADHFGARKYWLGVPAVLLSTLVGTSVFATIERQPELWLQIIVGLASVAAALLASLQTFMGYAERAEKHRMAGARYGALGRELEQMRASGIEFAPETIAEIRKRIDDLALEAPNNPLKIYRRAGATNIAVLKDED
jgi:hypothetical protein